MGANHVRAMGLTLRGPDEFCNCCDTKQGKDRSGFLFGRNTTSSTEWQQQQAGPTVLPKESWDSRRPTPPKPAAPVQSECHHDEEENEDLVGTFITDNFALPGPAQQQMVTNKSPNRSLFQSHDWRPGDVAKCDRTTSSSTASSCSETESSDTEACSDEDTPSGHAAPCQPVFISHDKDNAKENQHHVDRTHYEDIAQHCISVSKGELACLDSDSDYTVDTDLADSSPCLHTRAVAKPTPVDAVENWATLGQQAGSVLDHLRVENSKLVKSAMMHEYLYWAQYAHN